MPRACMSTGRSEQPQNAGMYTPAAQHWPIQQRRQEGMRGPEMQTREPDGCKGCAYPVPWTAKIPAALVAHYI